MSQEVFNIFKTMDRKDLKSQLALQCAPLLTGIKISNLLIVHNDKINHVIETFKGTQISTHIICKRDKKTTFLLYIKDELLSYLNSNKIEEIMNSLSYSSLEFDYILEEFSKRYSKYMIEKKVFPHEIGFLLGYPIDDVIGFIENDGKNSIYTGYWKVYSNLSEKISLFDKYNKAKDVVIGMVVKGMSIQSILDIHYSNKFNKIAI